MEKTNRQRRWIVEVGILPLISCRGSNCYERFIET